MKLMIMAVSVILYRDTAKMKQRQMLNFMMGCPITVWNAACNSISLTVLDFATWLTTDFKVWIWFHSWQVWGWDTSFRMRCW